MKKDAHYKYKLAIRDAAEAFESQFSHNLFEHYLQKDMKRLLGKVGGVNIAVKHY